jgi:hypothetical protein
MIAAQPITIDAPDSAILVRSDEGWVLDLPPVSGAIYEISG